VRSAVDMRGGGAVGGGAAAIGAGRRGKCSGVSEAMPRMVGHAVGFHWICEWASWGSGEWAEKTQRGGSGPIMGARKSNCTSSI
jgi:hypothetical protein